VTNEWTNYIPPLLLQYENEDGAVEDIGRVNASAGAGSILELSFTQRLAPFEPKEGIFSFVVPVAKWKLSGRLEMLPDARILLHIKDRPQVVMTAKAPAEEWI
jgi:hypothetical protein